MTWAGFSLEGSPMSNTDPSDNRRISRRRILQQSGGTIAALGLGTIGVGHASADESTDYCSETTLRPGMVHYDDSMHDVCRDDHPESEALQEEVKQSLEETYSTVGALIDEGYIPYFDFFADGDWSHWIQPEFIGDDSMVDPERPESILVDHQWWRPIGVMFVATIDGEDVDSPPSIYEEDDDAACTPWHAHVGFPGRYAWWKYRQVYEDGGSLPCRTPWMLHVWIHSHEKSIYAHGAPEERGGAPAEPAGFDTDVDTDEETLGPEHLPDAIKSKVKDLW